jgi:transcriptional pleiotropic repressor
MSVKLLDKTRKINWLLHNSTTARVSFNDICKIMMETLNSNILIISRKGKILGISQCSTVRAIKDMMGNFVGEHIDQVLNDRFLNVLSTKENVNLTTLGFDDAEVVDYRAIVNPIEIAGERLGTVFMYRDSGEYGIEDIIISEYCSTVVGMEMMRSKNEETAEQQRKLQVVKSALGTLSFSETEAIIHIFEELNGPEGILVASRIADRAQITRSGIVNALRKFESAGVITSRSSGMRGTYIKVLNDVLFTELDKLREQRK